MTEMGFRVDACIRGLGKEQYVSYMNWVSDGSELAVLGAVARALEGAGSDMEHGVEVGHEIVSITVARTITQHRATLIARETWFEALHAISKGDNNTWHVVLRDADGPRHVLNSVGEIVCSCCKTWPEPE